MASNKKAQILAAVMCASSIFGSYTVVSAADTPTKIESTDKNSSVTANGSTITATAGAQGISASATKKDEDGNTTGGISTTGAVTGTSLNIIAENTAGNKTTSTVGATGVTDAVYGTDGARVAYSNVGTGGISNTTSLKTTTGKIDTAIKSEYITEEYACRDNRWSKYRK